MTFSSLRRALAAAAAAALLLTAAGCGKKDTSILESSSVPTTTTTTTAPQPVLGLNRLTGLHDMETDNDRPIGVVVTDESATLVQINLEKADMFFEAETEAGIPRILAIFSSVDRLPDEIGPVRSARPHFVKFAKALDCIYCHIGGSQTGLETIQTLKVDDITGCETVNAVLKSSKNYSWNRKTFVRDKVLSRVDSRKMRKTTTTAVPFQFGKKAGCATANTVVVKLSEAYDMAFTYDAEKGQYLKHRSSLDTPVHTTHTGGPIAVSNVIVMYDHRTLDEVYSSGGHTANRYDFDLKSGSGLLASGGTSREIRWTNSSDGLHYYESDGVTPLTVTEGKTFVCLASDTLRSRTTVN